MTHRERFRRIMSFQKPDRIPLWDLEGITEGAVRQWCIDGFPPGRKVQEFLRFDPHENVPLSTGPIPSFVPRVIEEDEETVTTIDQYGFRVKTVKERAVAPTVYYYVEGSVKDQGLGVQGDCLFIVGDLHIGVSQVVVGGGGVGVDANCALKGLLSTSQVPGLQKGVAAIVACDGHGRQCQAKKECHNKSQAGRPQHRLAPVVGWQMCFVH